MTPPRSIPWLGSKLGCAHTLCTIRQSTNNTARRKAQNARKPPTTEHLHDGTAALLRLLSSSTICSRRKMTCKRSRRTARGSGPYQHPSYIVGPGSLERGGRHMTDPRGVHDERRGDRRAAGRHRRGGRPQPGERRRDPHRRRRALPHGELLQDPRHGRGHATGRRRRAAARRPAHADRGGQEPGQHADPLPRGAAAERARPPLPDDHPERQHRHRHAVAARRTRVRQRDHAAPRPGDDRLLHAEPRVLPHRVRRRRGVGRAERPRDRRPLARARGARRVRGRVLPRPRGERAPQRRRASCTSTSAAGGATSRSATTTRSPSTRRSTTCARRATWPRSSRWSPRPSAPRRRPAA